MRHPSQERPHHNAGVSLTADNAARLRRLVAAHGVMGASAALGCSPTLVEKLLDHGTARADSVARVVVGLRRAA